MRRKLMILVMALSWEATALAQGSTRPPRPCEAAADSPRGGQASEALREADQLLANDLEGAVAKYEEGVFLDPSNHRNIYKLAKAYQKKESWEKVASALARAVQLAPTRGNYWYERGHALIQIAERTKTRESWEEAKGSLVRCTETDPHRAECYHELGTAMVYLDDEAEALRNYTRAIERSPDVGEFYLHLADLYTRLDHVDHAEAVLKEGLRRVTDADKAKVQICMMLAIVAMLKSDLDAAVAATEMANRLRGSEHLEVLFNLASLYAKQTKNNQAAGFLKMFLRQACTGSSDKYNEYCEQARALLTNVESTGKRGSR